MTDHLLQEVDAELRAEKMAALWRRYRRPLLIAVIGVIALTAATSIWQHYHEKRGGELMLQFKQAQALYEDGSHEEAAGAFADLSAATSGELRTLAELWHGRALAAAGKEDGAIAAFTVASSGTPGLWSDLACLRLASLDSEAAKPCLASSKNTPLLSQRREWKAATQWAAGERDAAITTLEELATSPDTNEPARARISQWLSTLRAEPAKAGE